MTLADILPTSQVREKLLDRLAYARDASLYRLVPQAVVRPLNEAEVIHLLAYARQVGTTITFRTGGTSLSGQAVTNGILAETVWAWQEAEIHDAGTAITLEPGIIGAHANLLLQPYQRKIGPDPASINAARIGGIIANNASGMCCGVANNAYHTLQKIRFILANGQVYDTGRREDYGKFVEVEDELAEGLLTCKREIESQPELRNKIRHKYRIKNTLGYSLNAFLDFDHPLDIFAHLLVGSEGTLAFISQVTLQTLPDPPFKATGLILFPSMEAACGSISFFSHEGAAAVEVMDYASLTTAKYLPQPLYDVHRLRSEQAALLVEYQEEVPDNLQGKVENTTKHLEEWKGKLVNSFQTEMEGRNLLWQLRKGLYPTVGSLRRTGTSVVTEDICYDVENLPAVVSELHHLFQKWSFEDAVIFGHAKDGNLHFVTSIDLESQAGIQRYDGLMQDLVDLTVSKFDGSLKAEHGTGRNMAPFVEKEWGSALYRIMQRVKELSDPNNILNPGVLITTDSKVHLKDLKPIPLVDQSIDLCVECGFCEDTCPSRELTLTPRQRIAIAREMALIEKQGHTEYHELKRALRYGMENTCAADGLCALSCPVNINTGQYVKTLRSVHHSSFGLTVAQWTVDHFSATQQLLRAIVGILSVKSKLVGAKTIAKFSRSLSQLTGNVLPQWNPDLPGLSPRIKDSSFGKGQPVVYYPSCINRVFSAKQKKVSLTEVMGAIASRAGIRLIIPKNIHTSCCGTPYQSKGYDLAYRSMLEKTINLLYEASDGGAFPIVIDTSPCTYQLLHSADCLSPALRNKWSQLTFQDLVPFLWKIVKDQEKDPLARSVLIHVTCSTRKLGQTALMRQVAEACAAEVFMLTVEDCCAFAGDRGLLFPELTASATRRLVKEIKQYDPSVTGYSTSRMCEVGLQSATRRAYISLACLVRDYLYS